MSNYRRLISYIYAYEGGVKGKNIGYAKIEMRGSQCRVYVNVKKIYVGSSDIGVYLLAGGDEISLGNIFIRSGMGEFRVTVQSDNVEGSGHSMESCYGLTVHDRESAWRSYTTIWEDAVAQAAEVSQETPVSDVTEKAAELELADVTSEHMRAKEAKQEKAPQPETLSISREIERELEAEEMRLQDVEPWETMSGPESGLESRAASGSVTGATSGPASETAMKPASESTAGVGAEPASGSESGSVVEIMSEPESGAAVESMPEPESEMGSKLASNPEPEITMETTSESASGIGAKSVPDPEPEIAIELSSEPTPATSAEQESSKIIELGAQRGETIQKPERLQHISHQGYTDLTRKNEHPAQGAWRELQKIASAQSAVPQPQRVYGMRPENEYQAAISEKIQETASVEMPSGMQDGNSEELQGRLSEQISEEMQKETQKEMPSEMPMNAPERMPSRGENQRMGIVQERVQQMLQTLAGSIFQEPQKPVPPIRPEAQNRAAATGSPARSGSSAQPGSPVRNGRPEPNPPELEDPTRLALLDRQEQEDHSADRLWEQLGRRYARVLAFDYDHGCEIFSIKPQDIGLLPRETWVYGNNSFLLHGYYNYRHLILAKLFNPQGEPRYLLGVPGHYFSNEKYMASMFGFPHFVLAKRQPQGDGRFGYWYADIRL